MGYPRKFLNAGEEVVVDVRPHWWYLSGPAAAVVIVIGGAIVALVQSVASWLAWVVVTVLVVAVGWLVIRYVKWSTTRLVVTTSRIIERKGVLARRGREIPLTALTDIGYRQSLFDRVIGAGDVVVESAGKDGHEIFADLPRPQAIHNAIYREMELARANRAQWMGPQQSSIPDQIDQLDQLRRRGVISQEEFDAKKADLLNRL
jgi:membrane protein YdbS with pleckstrin-like domain